MRTNQEMLYVFLALTFYFMFLGGILFLAWNVERVARDPIIEAVVNKVRYNLREIPRVDYTEMSSDSEEEQVVVKRRRDRNPIGRMIEFD